MTGCSLRKAAGKCGINFMPLQRYCSEMKIASDGQDIYNVDETGMTTVQNPRNTTAMDGTNKFGAVTTVERGSLVTMTLAVSANGNSVPLFFPRKIFKRRFRSNAPQGSSGSSNKSERMTGHQLF
ncbi:hypothetical protein AVEN_226844-1 [Araneus ventricosus]|uniref:DDE-1 domain-containing protein n=1 Tax=Araneus ventricosus TaxID=182803 RepID=A0A4Y2F1M8_ARAVE|nr:hypothetical protein AVEN_226844-1 [Araneus ventricosus]